jgi:hypothetical protein
MEGVLADLKKRTSGRRVPAIDENVAGTFPMSLSSFWNEPAAATLRRCAHGHLPEWPEK